MFCSSRPKQPLSLLQSVQLEDMIPNTASPQQSRKMSSSSTFWNNIEDFSTHPQTFGHLCLHHWQPVLEQPWKKTTKKEGSQQNLHMTLQWHIGDDVNTPFPLNSATFGCDACAFNTCGSVVSLSLIPRHDSFKYPPSILPKTRSRLNVGLTFTALSRSFQASNSNLPIHNWGCA